MFSVFTSKKESNEFKVKSGMGNGNRVTRESKQSK